MTLAELATDQLLPALFAGIGAYLGNRRGVHALVARVVRVERHVGLPPPTPEELAAHAAPPA